MATVAVMLSVLALRNVATRWGILTAYMGVWPAPGVAAQVAAMNR